MPASVLPTYRISYGFTPLFPLRSASRYSASELPLGAVSPMPVMTIRSWSFAVEIIHLNLPAKLYFDNPLELVEQEQTEAAEADCQQKFQALCSLCCLLFYQ